MLTKQIQTLELKLEKCKEACRADCFIQDRHYPYNGSLDLIPEKNTRSIDLIRINIMFGPDNKLNKGWRQNPNPTVEPPEGYNFYTSCSYGSEDWNRYWWLTGRLLWKLVAGDVVQEKFYALPKTDLTPEQLRGLDKKAEDANTIREIYRNFLVIEDSVESLKLYKMDSMPKDPMALLKKLKRT